MAASKTRRRAISLNEAGSELLNQAIENSKVTCDPDAVDDMYDQLVTTYTAMQASMEWSWRSS